MANRTDDRVIRDTMKRDPKSHAEMARRFIGKMQEKLKKPGITGKDQTRILKKMRAFDKIRKKFESGTGLSQERKY